MRTSDIHSEPNEGIATPGLQMAGKVKTMPASELRKGMCPRSAGDVNICRNDCARPCSFGLRLMALEDEKAAQPRPDWQKQMQQEAIQRAQTCQQYINGGHDEATAALLAGYKSTAGWNTARKKYSEHLADLPPMKKYQEVSTMANAPRHVRITQVSGTAARFTLNENNLVTIESPNIQTDGQTACSRAELRTFLQELTEALAIFTEPEEQHHED